jgi:tetratricopeptide (TPR) repeat protein
MELRRLTRILASALALCWAGVLSGAACAQPTDQPAPGQGVGPGQNFIEIPGVGRIPILPGARGFQPRSLDQFGDEDAAEPLSRPPPGKPPKALSKPVEPHKPAKTPEQARAEALNALLARLKDASDEAEAQAVGVRIATLFATTSSDTIALLAARAAAAELVNAQAVAEALLDHVVMLDPFWSEGFVRRSRSKAARGDAEGAVADLETAVRLEPRRFDALAAIAALKEEAGDKKGALAAYRRALALDPRQETWRKAEERLRFEVEGRDI